VHGHPSGSANLFDEIFSNSKTAMRNPLPKIGADTMSYKLYIGYLLKLRGKHKFIMIFGSYSPNLST
jgi:hypothetical protein